MPEVKYSISVRDLKKSNGRLLGYLRYGGIYKEKANNNLAILVHIRGILRNPIPYHLDELKVSSLIENLESIKDNISVDDREKFEKTMINSKAARSGIKDANNSE